MTLEKVLIPEELKKEYNSLYNKFLDSNSEVVNSFVMSKSIVYLKTFCKVNNISISPKNQLINEIVKWFQQRKVISSKIIHVNRKTQ